MRPIKFRAWDKKDKEMLYGVDLQYSGQGGLESIRHDDLAGDGDPESNPNWEGCRDIDDFELMQFTGLLDKKGKEIYEGDILAGYKHEDGGEFIDDVVGIMKYEGLSFAIEGKQKKSKELWFYTMTSDIKQDNAIEVIGNIYENPEQLKKEMMK